MIQPLVSAARVVCYLNGRRAGTVTRFGHTSETPTHELGGLDSFDPFELAPTSTKVSGTVGLYRIAGLGGVEGMGLTAQYEALSRQKYATVQLLDRLTGAQLFAAHQCMLEVQRWDVSAKGIMEGSFSFRGISWSNENFRKS